jgi:hypothetical protein
MNKMHPKGNEQAFQEVHNFSYIPIKKKVSKETEKQKGLTFPESAGGRGKIRYIGGWCISQVRKRKIQQITKCLYKQNKTNG